MTVLKVPGDFITAEPGFYDENGTAQAFFYFRNCDRASDIFLDSVGVGEKARREINRSTYSATANLTVKEAVPQETPLRFEVSVLRIGGKSFGYRTQMFGASDEKCYATYDSVAVCMDMTGPTPISLPEEVRDALSAYLP
ncbi:MAG: thioesterase family protein [Alphaproteobacteria bacterium]|nr:thioesterase family protein [Alphaproteobacteria bacterium]